MIPMGAPQYQGTTYFRYENREQRVALQSLIHQLKYPYPDVTSITEFSNGYNGVAKVKISEWVERKMSITHNVQKAREWLEQKLIALNIPKVTEETTPTKAIISFRYKDREQRGTIQNMAQGISHPYPETTSVSIFPNPRAGIAKIEISELKASGPSTHLVSNTPKTQQALEWIEGILKSWQIEKISEELAQKI